MARDDQPVQIEPELVVAGWRGVTGMSKTDGSKLRHRASNNLRVPSAVDSPVIMADIRGLKLEACSGT